MPCPVELGANVHCTDAPGILTESAALRADCSCAASPLKVCGIGVPLPNTLMVRGRGEGAEAGRLVDNCRLKSSEATVVVAVPPTAVFTLATVSAAPTTPLIVTAVVGGTPGKDALTSCEPLSGSLTTAVR